MKPSFVRSLFNSPVCFTAAVLSPAPSSDASPPCPQNPSARLYSSLYGLAALSTLTVTGAVQAQSDTTPTLGTIEVRGAANTPARQSASVGDLSDRPLSETPQGISVLRAPALVDAGSRSLSGAIRSETSTSDSYNTVGYFERLQIRGFVLEESTNYRRDGMPVSSHEPVALENKERIEILKGLSGMQAGVSSPGGLINYTLKRPTAAPLREVFLGVSERGTTLLHGDFGGRLGEGQQFGYRINAALEEKRPMVDNARGNRQFLSGFFDWRLNKNTLVEAEFEFNKSSQPSVPGYSLLDTGGVGYGTTLPAVPNPRLNLNAQSWSLPFESRSLTGSLGIKQALDSKWLGGNWSWGARLSQQNIRTNDRIAFPDGCSSAPTYVYPGFCGNGDFDVYDFRSNNERRTMSGAQAFLRGEIEAAGIRHEVRASLTQQKYRETYETYQAYNWAGIGNLYTPFTLAGDPSLTTLNTQRNSRSTELSLSDTMGWGNWSLWLGLRHTSLNRNSVKTDGSEAVQFDQAFTTPFAALGYKVRPGTFIYASAGQGIETEAVPNLPAKFVNAGQVLQALRSHQVEVGLKQQMANEGLWSLTLFQINKPYYQDETSTSNASIPAGMVQRSIGGLKARHQGLEASWMGKLSPELNLSAQATWLDARIRDLNNTGLGGRTPNTAAFTAALQLAWQVPQVSGLSWTNRANYSSAKAVTLDQSVTLPSYWQWDSWVNYRTRLGGTPAVLRAGIDNVLDRRYWKDAPTQYWGGIYMFPAMPRIFRVSLQMSF